jgi:hypothetical protein
MQVAFANFGEVPIAVQYKYAVYKNISAGQYPGLAYVLAVAALHIPIAIAESLVFSAILYFMSGLAPEAGRFFFFAFALFMTDIGACGVRECCAGARGRGAGTDVPSRWRGTSR